MLKSGFTLERIRANGIEIPEHPEAVLSELNMALMVDRFHWPPSWILGEDHALLQRIWALIGEIDRIRNGAKAN